MWTIDRLSKDLTEKLHTDSHAQVKEEGQEEESQRQEKQEEQKKNKKGLADSD